MSCRFFKRVFYLSSPLAIIHVSCLRDQRSLKSAVRRTISPLFFNGDFSKAFPSSISVSVSLQFRLLSSLPASWRNARGVVSLSSSPVCAPISRKSIKCRSLACCGAAILIPAQRVALFTADASSGSSVFIWDGERQSTQRDRGSSAKRRQIKRQTMRARISSHHPKEERDHAPSR